MTKAKLSKNHLVFLHSKVGSHEMPESSRENALINVMTSTPRPSNKNMPIWDMARSCKKLHDGEPAVIIKELERRFPHYFDTLPVEPGSEITEIKKAAFISLYITCRLYDGNSRYIKRRKKKSDEFVLLS
jgi:hypothetical protein